jgi:hypothetical protein
MLQLALQFGGAMVIYLDWKNSFSMMLTDLPVNAYIAVGGDEPPSMTILNEELIERLSTRNYTSLRLSSEFFTGASHSQVPMIGFRNGIQFVLNQ